MKLSGIFTFIILAASVYFFTEYNFVVAVILLVLGLSRLFGYSLTRLVNGINAITTNTATERKVNASIEIKLNIVEILDHEVFSEVFKKLKGNEGLKLTTEAAWKKQLLENFKKIYKEAEDHTTDDGKRYLWEKVKFNIKNGLLWKNGEIDFNDSIYHGWFVPHVYVSEEEEKDRWTEDIRVGVSIRVFAVNGMIKVQVGSYNKDQSPRLIRDGFLAVYQTWTTVTTFPLMYFLVSHNIPSSYFNLSMYATDSYREHLAKDSKINFTDDWKAINAEVSEYNYITNLPDDETIPDQKKFQEISTKFNEKREAILAKENFIDPYARKDDDYHDSYFDDNNINFRNDYVSIFIANMNEFKEKKEKYLYPDFYEERP